MHSSPDPPSIHQGCNFCAAVVEVESWAHQRMGLLTSHVTQAYHSPLTKLFPRSGRETLLEDDFKEDQVEEELVPLRLQMAFADAALRNHAQAQQQFEVQLILSPTVC